MQSLEVEDLRWCIRRLPALVCEALKGPQGLVVAGGFIRSVVANEPINDVQ